jgi:hypothetical protein
MHAYISTRRLARTLALLVSIGALVAALAGASQTLAQTRGRAACHVSSRHAKARRHPHVCTTRSHKRHHKHARGSLKRRAARHAKGRRSHAAVKARCENGSAPTLLGEGSFSCDDGSQPECDNGATPTPGANQVLLCPVLGESEAAAGEPTCEELEEEEAGCASEPEAQACEVADAACEQQG